MLEKESPQSQCGAHVGDPGALSTEAKLMHAESFYAVVRFHPCKWAFFPEYGAIMLTGLPRPRVSSIPLHPRNLKTF